MPGRKFFLAAHCLMMSAAKSGSLLKRWRLIQKNDCSTEGNVKVICCQTVSGNVFKAVWIQLSVPFLPQDEQKRDLHEWGAFTFIEQSLQTKT